MWHGSVSFVRDTVSRREAWLLGHDPGLAGREWLGVLLALVTVGAVAGVVSDLPVGSVGPGVLALAVGGSTDRSNPLERLTDDVRAFVDRIDDADDAGRPLPEGEFRLDRNDELGELSAAIDDLTSAVADRTRQLAARERELNRYREFTDEVLGAIDDVFYVIDDDGDLVRWNERLVEATGYSDAELTEMNALEFYDGPDRESIADAIDEVVETGEARVEASVVTATGERVPYEFSASRLEDPDGNPVIAGIGRDITDRKRYERELEAATERLDSVISNAPVILYALDPDGDFTLSKGHALDALGLEPGDVVGESAFEVYGDHEGIVEDLERALDGEPVNAIREIGETIFESTYRPVVDDDGDLTKVIGVSIDVTERKRRQRELRERERELSTLMSNVPGMVYRCANEPDWPFEFVSEGALELTGYEPEQLVDGSVNWARDVILEDHDELWAAVQRAVDARDPYQVTFPIETADGERRWVREQGRGVFDDDGSLEHLEGVIIDVTEQVESKHELERTQRLLEQTKQLASVGGWELDVREEPYNLRWTAETGRIHGLEPDVEMTLEEAIEFYHPADLPTVESAVDRAITEAEPYELEVRLQTPDDDQRWVRILGEPVLEGGEVVAVHGSIQDVTDRKEHERELERSETIIQALDELVYVVDDEGTFQFLSDALTPITGYEPDELLGEHASTVLAEGDVELTTERIRELLRADDASRTFELDLRTKDGELVHAENHMALLPMVDGEFQGTAGVLRDVTERRERERELERTRALLERVEQLAGIGGWELDLRTEPRTPIWTTELYRLHGLPQDTEPGLSAAIEQYHPEDRARVRRTLEAAISSETVYDLEARMQPTPEETRWVHGFGVPVYEDGDLVKYQGALQDVTDLKQRELALESLHEAARGLLGAETADDVAAVAVDAAADVLEATGVALYRLDAAVNRLVPIAHTDAFDRLSSDDPSATVGNGDSVLWNAFVTGAQTVVDDPAAFDRSQVFDAAVESAVVVPVGDHGVLTVASDGAPIDAQSRRSIETLVATTEAAFDRLESEASLRERDAELEARNRRLRRQITINDTIRRVNQSLIGATSRAEIERTVPERLVEADGVAFAWIGRPDAADASVEPVAWAGSNEEYLDRISLDVAGSTEPACETARSDETTVVENVIDELQREPWRRQALDAGFQSVISVPLELEEYSYGVLTVYATEPDAFTALERTVFTELGEAIANAVTATKTREALHAETLVELTFALSDSADVLSRIASLTDARVSFEGLGTNSGEDTVLFFETRGPSPDAVGEVLADLVSVSDHRLISHDDDDDRCRFEVLVAGDSLASQLVRHGASPRTIRADGDETVVTVDVPTGTDVREFLAVVADHHGEVELRSRRHVERTLHTRRELVGALFDDLTDRQLEVLRTAYFAGFFEWPRESTGEDVAEMLDVSQPTVNRHLRIAQQRLLAKLFESETATPAEG